MRKLAFLPAVFFSLLVTVAAQTVCPGYNVVVNTPEDQLMLAVNGADNPQEQVAALDKFVQEHADSKFIPCAYEYEVMDNVKANNFDKAIQYGEKDLAANYKDLNLLINLAKAYVGAGKATDAAFQVIFAAPDQMKSEAANAAKPANMSDDDWKKSQAETLNDDTAYLEYAFYNLLPRITDPAKSVALLGQFEKAYPDAATKNPAQLNYQYFVAYARAGRGAEADPYGEKVIAADPNNVEVLNGVAYDYANRRVSLDKATEYAKKVLVLVPAMKKPDGLSDDQFKTEQNNQLGMAHVTLGYIDFQRAGKTHRVAPAIQEFRTAVGLLGGNPQLRGAALYYMGNAYEFEVPPNHKAAAEALGQAAAIQSPWQTPAQSLLAKVRSAERR